MFTGIVGEIGNVRERHETEGLVRLTIACRRSLADLRPGDSIAVNGCCQTVIAVDEESFRVEVMPQTSALTTLGFLNRGDAVNLERALRAGDRLDGHLVQGHIDGVGEVTQVTPEGADRRVRIRPPAALGRYMVPRGSVSIDGVSLTVASVRDDQFEVALIPTTCRETLAGNYRRGHKVNVEVDIVARYLERLLETSGSVTRGAGE